MKDKGKKDCWRKRVAWEELEKEWDRCNEKEREWLRNKRKEEEIHREPYNT